MDGELIELQINLSLSLSGLIGKRPEIEIRNSRNVDVENDVTIKIWFNHTYKRKSKRMNDWDLYLQRLGF